MSKPRPSLSIAALTGICLIAVGCIPSLAGNEPREPTNAIPQSFSIASSSSNNAATQPSAATQMVWREFFESAELKSLIEVALEKNQDLNIELQEIIIARTEVSARQGAYLPKVNIGVGAGLERVGKNTSQGISDDAHRLPENLGSANARQIQAVLSYERTMLQAFTDVANQIAMIENLEKGYELQVQQVEALARSSEVSKILFQSARADYMEVLLTQRDLLDAQMELIETRKRQWLAVVNLYQALGGGWRSNDSKSAPAPSK